MRDRALAWWRERSDREHFVLVGGAAVLVVLLGYFLVLDPVLARHARLDRLVVQRQADLDRVIRLGAEYREAADRVAALDRRVAQPGGFSLLSFLEQTAAAQQMRGRLASIRPQPSQTLHPYRELSAEVKLESITLPQIVAYFQALDRAPQRLRVKYLRLKTRYADPKLLDGSFLVSTYERVS